LTIIVSLILFCFMASKYYCHQCRLITGAYLRLGTEVSGDEHSGAKGDDTMNSAGQRVLLAVRDPRLAATLREALLRSPAMRLAGIIDPTIDRALGEWSAYVDTLLIGADELLWLQRTAIGGSFAAIAAMRVVVLLQESQILDLFYQIEGQFDLVFEENDHRFLAERIDLAAAGYVVLPAPLLMRWLNNHLRRRMTCELSSNERRVLACIGRALSNKGIAAETGFAESEVKALVQSTMRKLRIKNRTTVAIFAATTATSDNRCAD
jgi:DNA-binding CsgD family transcriptional regulator